MFKKSMALVVTLLALNTSIAKADVANYVVNTNMVNKTYSAEALEQSFLNYKSGVDDGELYKSFIKDLTNGKFIAFQDENSKFVNYDEIQTEFLNCKISKIKFNLVNFIKEAKGIEVKSEKVIIKNKEEIDDKTTATIYGKKSPKGVYFNNTKIEKTQSFYKHNTTYVPIAEIAKKEGVKIIKNNSADVRFEYKGKEYHFGTSMNVYEIDDEEYPMSVTKINGVNVPNYTPVISCMDILYVPTNIIKDIFHKKITVCHDSKLVYIGQAPSVIPKDIEAEGEAIAKKKFENSNKAVTEGWVCPILNKTSKDDIYDDMDTMVNELEFFTWKPETGRAQTALYSPFPSFTDKNEDRAMPKTIIGREYGTNESYYWNSVQFFGYHMPNGTHNPYLDKLEKINPQVLKYYFPTKWQYLHDVFMKDKEINVKGKHLTLDGRDIYITEGNTSVTVYFSKIGGKISIGR